MCNHHPRTTTPFFQRIINHPALSAEHKKLLCEVYGSIDDEDYIACFVPLLAIIDDLLEKKLP